MMLSEKPRSPVSEHRKVTKSVMEKKRRARINSSLTELKTILAGIMAYKDERFEKMEKADILEMTVNYVRQLQNKSSDKDNHPLRDGGDYRTGVNACIGEVIRYVTSSDICDTHIKTKLLDDLANKVNSLPAAPKSPACINSPITNKTFTINVSGETTPTTMADANNNTVNVGGITSQTTPISVYTTTQMPLNSLQAVSAYTPQMVSPVNSIQTAITVPNAQNISQVSQQGQQQQVMPNVPLTIFVPANFCTTAAGTTCVIPLTLSNSCSDGSAFVLNTNNLSAGDTDSRVVVSSPDSSSDANGQRIPTHSNVNRNINFNTNVAVDPVHSSEDIDEPRAVSTEPRSNEVYDISDSIVIGQRRDELERPSENVSLPKKAPELLHSEHSSFQKYRSRKAPSPLNSGRGLCWRPW